MPEVVIHRFIDHGRAEPFIRSSTEWLTDEMGFDRYMIKMIPKKNRWEDCLAPENTRIECLEKSFRYDVDYRVRNWYWDAHVDEFYQDVGIDEPREKLYYLLRQSGPNWVRWYVIFVDDPETNTNVRYYFATIFENEIDALTYKLSI